MTREQKYAEQLKEIGVYREAFEPEIRMLAMMERELQRMVKDWKAAGSPVTDVNAQGTAISNKQYDAICSMRRDILAHRDALGLTPKGLQRLVGKREQKNGGAGGEKNNVLAIVQKRRQA